MTIEPELSDKQKEAFRILYDDETTEFLIGGGAGGSKSTLGCMWLITNALKFPHTRWLMGRSKLNSLKETTFVTFLGVCRMWGIQSGVHFDYNSKDNYIQFREAYGGSRILMKDLFLYPSDPEFDSLGSLEITAAFIDEVNQCNIKAKNIVASRIRYKLADYCKCGYPTEKSEILGYNDRGIPNKWLCGGCGEVTEGLLPRLLMSCNPDKNWTYKDFYRPFKNGNLPKYRKFLQMLAADNPWISPHYIENLKKMDEMSKQRLLFGNWEYDDDDNILMDYDNIINIFTNILEPGKPYITCDVGRKGKDPTVVLAWDGWTVVDVKKVAQTKTTETVRLIRDMQYKYGVPIKNIVVDEGGVGGGVVDTLGCVGFVASGGVIYVKGTKENYLNLKAQCAFRFAEVVNRGGIAFQTNNVVWQEEIAEELEQIRRKDPDKDGKMNIEGKDKIREAIGRSTDWFDALSIRVVLELKQHRRFKI